MNFNFTKDATSSANGSLISITEVLKIRIPRQLLNRRIFAWMDWFSDKTTLIGVEGELVLKNNGQVAGTVPFAAYSANGTTRGAKGAFSMLSTGGNVVNNSGILTVPTVLDSGQSSAPLQAFDIRAEIDEISFVLNFVDDRFSKMNGYFVWIGCASFS